MHTHAEEQAAETGDGGTEHDVGVGRQPREAHAPVGMAQALRLGGEGAQGGRRAVRRRRAPSGAVHVAWWWEGCGVRGACRSREAPESITGANCASRCRGGAAFSAARGADPAPTLSRAQVAGAAASAAPKKCGGATRGGRRWQCGRASPVPCISTLLPPRPTALFDCHLLLPPLVATPVHACSLPSAALRLGPPARPAPPPPPCRAPSTLRRPRSSTAMPRRASTPASALPSLGPRMRIR
jgi:hypothetical protein